MCIQFSVSIVYSIDVVLSGQWRQHYIRKRLYCIDRSGCGVLEVMLDVAYTILS
jgi:hypothetical protein